MFQQQVESLKKGNVRILPDSFIVLICICCGATCRTLIHRFRSSKKSKMIESMFDSIYFSQWNEIIYFIVEGDIAVVTGEDAGLMKGLTTPGVIGVLPQHHNEPATLIIDSTKPVYPRIQ